MRLKCLLNLRAAGARLSVLIAVFFSGRSVIVFFRRQWCAQGYRTGLELKANLELLRIFKHPRSRQIVFENEYKASKGLEIS